jgi:hypothetical protein
VTPMASGAQAPQQAPAQAPLIPFSAAGHWHVEPAFTTQTPTLGAAVVNIGPLDVSAFGYLRHIVLECVGAGGTLGAGALHPDYPFNLFQSITLFDVNGAPIFGPLGGYQSLWANIVGGYVWSQDPRRNASYVGTINFTYLLRIPIEILAHNGLGSLGNQNAAAAYKVQLAINPTTALFTTAPTTAPTVTIKGWLEAWTLPSPSDMAGRPQAQIPPAHGTTQYWSVFKKQVNNGSNTILFPRVGNLIRAIIMITRNTTAQGAGDNARDSTVFPSNPQLLWDARMLYNEDQLYRLTKDYEVIENLFTQDAGVFFYPFNCGGDGTQGRSGDEQPNLWLPTVQASRLELDGTVASGTGGTMEVITNDIAPVEVVPQERYVETSATGFHPEVGVSGPAVQ